MVRNKLNGIIMDVEKFILKKNYYNYSFMISKGI